MRCCIVRHGETPWNTERRLQGHQDIPLNARGIAQAQAAARFLQQHHQQQPFAAVCSSDLLRTRQTAEAIADALALSVQALSALRERHFGEFEGKTPDEAADFDATAYQALVARADLEATPGQAEPLSAMVQRVECALAELVRHYADQSVIIVTHGGVLDVLYRRAMGQTLSGPRNAPIPNAGLNWLDLALVDDRLVWTMQAWGETIHLNDASLDEIL